MYDFNRLSELVLHHYESKLHPGFISFADLQKAMYLSNCDQVFFSRHIDRELEEPKEGTTILQLMEIFQAFAFEKGDDALHKSTAFSSQALSATADFLPAEPGKSRRGSLGPFPLKSKYCEHCWKAGFKQLHDMLTGCSFYRSHLARLAAKASSGAASVPKALVVSCNGYTPAPPVCLQVPPFASYVFDESDSEVSATETGMVSAFVSAALTLSFCALVQFWYDNCASYSLVADLSYLVDVVLLDKPF